MHIGNPTVLLKSHIAYKQNSSYILESFNNEAKDDEHFKDNLILTSFTLNTMNGVIIPNTES